ncbi:MAG: phosphoribosylformylglycinamidine synthase subunit PurQ [Deltaproteobacteria bacterium]|nr:phosphoribosylformylglycinamidine synthase subunit PurQ [Deltaproteobacteria bacterium]
MEVHLRVLNMEVKALVISGNGTNCEMETAYACRYAGASTDIIHLSNILNGNSRISNYHFLNLAGGFLDGDDLGSAQVESIRLKYARIKGEGPTLLEEIINFINNGGLILGVCNGFQTLVKAGLLPGNPIGKRRVSITFNDSARFEDRWVRLAINRKSPCVFTKGLDQIELPVRHGEGKFVTDTQHTLKEILEGNLATAFYSDKEGSPTMAYPDNPNGSVGAIAGVCDVTGRIFGLMPHPEAYTHATNHPLWTRLSLPERGQGLAIFDNAVKFLKGIR